MEDNYKNNMVFGIHPVLELTRTRFSGEKTLSKRCLYKQERARLN